MTDVTPLSKEQVTLRSKRLDWLHWLLLMVVLLQGFYLWFDPYTYRSAFKGHLVRISRFTGEAEQLSSQGWISLETKPVKAPTVERFILEPVEPPTVERFIWEEPVKPIPRRNQMEGRQ